MTSKTPLENITLLTWMATNRDPRFLENIIYAFEHKCRKKVTKVYYLYGGKPEDAGKLKQKIAEVKAFCTEKEVELVDLRVDITDPSDYDQLYNGMVKVLTPRLVEIGDVCVSISSGTNAMSIVWMLLRTMDFFNGRAKFYDVRKYEPQFKVQGSPICNKEDQKINEINFSVRKMYLPVSRKSTLVGDGISSFSHPPRSAKRSQAMEDLECYSSMPDSLLILGERGVGKSSSVREIVARIKSVKEDKVVEMGCGEFDKGIVGSVLFGHEKGAFTGAVEKRVGLIKTAENGILFLDEIQDLPKDVQRKLVRFLQDRKYRKVGGNTDESSNAQLVFASNNSIEMLREKLDPDFYDRISTFVVTIPPLRECPEDLPEDWNNVWRKVRSSSAPEEPPLTPELKAHFDNPVNLQGNMRSLQKVARHIIAKKAWESADKIREVLAKLEAENRLIGACDSGEAGLPGNAAFAVKDFKEFQNCSWDEAEAKFKCAMAQWAQEQYPSLAAAGKALGCTPRTLSNAKAAKAKVAAKVAVKKKSR